ncbi:hypothetical protein [Paenibacillus sp. LjRoot56]|uniref:hypothetical protein n=1 Tax=Paenibacillus sp. LjRoot56 TaxID=3342333 RepID=UPI003ECF52B3
MELNQDGYVKLSLLHERNNRTTTRDNWFEVSELIFKNHPLENKSDFIKIIAFAYSWMPTIPKLVGDIDWEYVHPALLELKKGNMAIRLDLLKILVPYINNSIVGTSKVLHYIAPEYVPIIDSRVINSWTKLFNSQFEKEMNHKHKRFTAYLSYWDDLNLWHSNLNERVRLRELESMLYGIDGNIELD